MKSSTLFFGSLFKSPQKYVLSKSDKKWSNQIHSEPWETSFSYSQDISLYSQGIFSTTDKKELSLLYSNRSQCYLNLKFPIYALSDAKISFLELDNTNAKSLMRICTAYLELKDYINAMKFFHELYKLTKDKSLFSKVVEISRKQEKLNKEFDERQQKGENVCLLFAFLPSKSLKIYDIPDYFAELVKDKPIQIAELPNFGKSLLALKDFKSGDVILIDKPFIWCTLNDKACDYCLKFFKKKYACPNCEDEIYCDKTCAELAWNTYHKSICGLGSRILKLEGQKGKSGSAKTPLMMFRLFGKMRQTEGWPFDISKHPAIESLSCSIDSKNNLPSYNFNEIYWILRNLWKLEENERFDFREYLDVVMKLNNNNYQITYSEETNDSGAGMYQITSFVNHSCLPNATYLTNGPKYGYKMILKAKKEIKKGEQIFISYIEDQKYEDRKIKLSQYGFDCKCLACQMEV